MKDFQQFVQEAAKTNWTTMGTAPSLEHMKKLLSQFWYNSPSDYSFKQISSNPEVYEITRKGKVLDSSTQRIVKSQNRFKFEAIL